MKFYPNDLFSYGANTKLVNIKLVNLLYQGRKTADFTADFAQWYFFFGNVDIHIWLESKIYNSILGKTVSKICGVIFHTTNF